VLGKRFRIEQRVGEGGMGTVFRATDLKTGQAVALKTLLPEAAKDPALRRRFEREAKILQKVEHPNFVRFLAYGSGSGDPAYVVMELLRGDALSKLLTKESRFVPQRALHITRHVLTGLQHAHGLGIVHRDVKPDNVVIVPADRDPEFAKILDFGIARLAEPDATDNTKLTQKGEIFGTPAYMAPEQVRGDPIDSRVDLYAVSVMLYEMLASRPPFVAKNQNGLFAMHLASAPPQLSELVPNEPQLMPLQKLLDVGLAKQPELRFASAADYLNKIEELIDTDWQSDDAGVAAVPAPVRPNGIGLPAGSPPGTPARVGPNSSLRSKSFVVAGLVALAIALWLLYGKVRP